MKVYSYTSIERPDRWCREEVACEVEDGRLRDTFWALGSETHTLTPAEVATAKFVFDTDDYDEIRESAGRGASRAKWVEYAREDRATIPSQHGLQVQYFVRKGAKPDLATKIENAREKLEKYQGELRSVTHRIEWAQKDLDELLSQALATV